MATSGQVNTNTTYDSFFWVYWSQDSQDIAGNKTRIYWSCGVTCGHSFYTNAIEMSAVTINGTQVYGGGTYSNFSKGEHRIAYGYLGKAGVSYEKINASEHPDLVKEYCIVQAPTLVVISSDGIFKYAGAGAIRKYLLGRGAL